MYTIYFLARFLPFWSLPLAFVCYELGMFYYNRRVKNGYMLFFGAVGLLLVITVVWVFGEGYWRAHTYLKEFVDDYISQGS